jgi:hypothetical protein
MKKQWTITENNDHEGETFGYILLLSQLEADTIRMWINDKDPDGEMYSIEQTSYRPELVTTINDHCDNTYLPRLNWCCINFEMSEINEMDEYELFYKHNGLTILDEPHYEPTPVDMFVDDIELAVKSFLNFFNYHD